MWIIKDKLGRYMNSYRCLGGEVYTSAWSGAREDAIRFRTKSHAESWRQRASDSPHGLRIVRLVPKRRGAAPDALEIAKAIHWGWEEFMRGALPSRKSCTWEGLHGDHRAEYLASASAVLRLLGEHRR
jgi:hypothetical protein